MLLLHEADTNSTFMIPLEKRQTTVAFKNLGDLEKIP